ncbi:MAG: S4A5 electrogenic sodium bicarbonate cotransporter 4 [Coriobacteriia bacterium]|nr:S4A5 electrogenic sodium bicarbonate cotransporter 4 [Coriobacteriia bacterium]
MAYRETGSVRIGPLSLFVLVVTLCMAVLAVLSFTTARASSYEANNQRDYTSGAYANEVAAQEFVALVDEQLAGVKEAGGTKEAAMEAVRSVSPDVAIIEESQVSVAFSSDQIRRLTVCLQVNDDLSYTVTKWKTSVSWPQVEDGQGYWPGKK